MLQIVCSTLMNGSMQGSHMAILLVWRLISHHQQPATEWQAPAEGALKCNTVPGRKLFWSENDCW